MGRFGASVLPPLGWFFFCSVRLCQLRSGYRGAPSRGWPSGRNPLLGRSASPCRFALCRLVIASLLLRSNFVTPPLSLRFAQILLGFFRRGSALLVAGLSPRSRSALPRRLFGSEIWIYHFFFLQLRNNLKIYCLCTFQSRFSSSFSAGCGCCWRWSLCCYSSGFGWEKARLTRF